MSVSAVSAHGMSRYLLDLFAESLDKYQSVTKTYRFFFFDIILSLLLTICKFKIYI